MDFDTDIIYSVFFVIIICTATFLIIFFKNDVKSRNRVFDFNYLAKIILYTLPFVAVIGIVTPLIVGLYNLALLGIYMAVPMIIAPVIYYVSFFKWLHKDDFRIEEV